MPKAIPAYQPQLVKDTDGAVIGEAYDLEIGPLYVLRDGGFMLAVDTVMERSDLEQLYQVIGQVLGSAAPALA